jgi:hypothetical protein
MGLRVSFRLYDPEGTAAFAIEADLLGDDGAVEETLPALGPDGVPPESATGFALVEAALIGIGGAEGRWVRIRLVFGSAGLFVDDVALAAACDEASSDPEAETPHDPVSETPEGVEDPAFLGDPAVAPEDPAGSVPGACASDADCEDGDPLTIDVCEGATCTATPNPDACAADLDCDDGDPCTVDACDASLCTHAGGYGDACCETAATPLADFDQGTQDGFYVTDNLETGVFWTPDKTRATSGKWSLYLGDPKSQTYAIGARVKSSATTPLFTVPAGGLTTARLDLFKATREAPDRDVLQVFVLREGALLPAWTSKSLPGAVTDGFEPVDVPLGGFAGTPVQLRFVFDTVDGEAPELEGVYLDRIRLETACE